MSENKHIKFFLTILYVLLAVACVWFVLKYALGWLAPFILAFIFSKIIDYPVSFFEKKLKFPRPISSLIFTVLFYGIIGTLVYLCASRLIDTLVLLFEKLRNLDIDLVVENIRETFFNILSRLPLGIQDFIYTNIEGWLSELVSAIQKLIAPVVSYTANIATILPSILIFIIVAIASTFFLSADSPKLRQKLWEISSENVKNKYKRIRSQISNTLVSYLRAVLILICITFVELSIGLSILRVPNAIVIASVIAIVDALPVLGSGWFLMPWAVVSAFSGNYFLAIGLVVIYVVITVVRNLIEPKIVGEQIGLHPLATLASIYIGLKLFGIIGMFTPILVALIKKFYDWGYFDFFKKKSCAPKPLDE